MKAYKLYNKKYFCMFLLPGFVTLALHMRGYQYILKVGFRVCVSSVTLQLFQFE